MATLVCECGSNLFWESRRTGGWWKYLLDGDGNIQESDLSGVITGPPPKTVRCAECGKIHPNPNPNV